jgi:hypothetical protein
MRSTTASTIMDQQDPTVPLLNNSQQQAYVHPTIPEPYPAYAAHLAAAAAAVPPAPSVFKLNSLQRFAIASFAVIRILRGVAFFAWPALGLSSFDIPESGPTFLLGCMIGSRDLLIGGLLWTADPTSRRETVRAVLVSLLGDAIDTCILIFSAACMYHWRNPVVEIIALAVLSIAEHLTLYSVSEDEYDSTRGGGAAAYAAGLQAMEDKKRRMDAWLADMRSADNAQPTTTTTTTQQQLQQQVYWTYRTSSPFMPPSSIAPESVV